MYRYIHHFNDYNQQRSHGNYGGSQRSRGPPRPSRQQGNNVPNRQPETKVGPPRNQNVEFFYDKEPFGHFYHAQFTLEETTFNCVEQYILCKKADMFKEKVMKTDPSNLNKYENAETFKTEEWCASLKAVAERGNGAKFQQNPKLKDRLLQTFSRKLVQAGRDTYWGIGLNKDNPEVRDENKWRGQNVLGEILTRIRDNHLQQGLKEAQLKYEYFWQKHSPYSQWFSASFLVEGFEFNCTEQYMMYKKAELFQDWYTAQQIVNEKSPFNQKALGRKVRNFDERVWNENCERIVEEGNMAKFSQNMQLKKLLFATYPRPLVEASPVDRIWGIGLGKENPLAWDERTWRGRNLLGKALTRVRSRLMSEEKTDLKYKDMERQNTTLSHREPVRNVDDRSAKKGNVCNIDGEDWIKDWSPTDEELLACDVNLPTPKKEVNERKGSKCGTMSGRDTLLQGSHCVSGDTKVVRQHNAKSMAVNVKAKEDRQNLRLNIFQQTQTAMNRKLKRIPETNLDSASEQNTKRRRLEDDTKIVF